MRKIISRNAEKYLCDRKKENAAKGGIGADMKKAVITLALVLALGTSGALVSCTANTNTDESGTGTNTSTTMPSETSTDGKGTGNVIDDAESKLEDMSEHATHGVTDETPGGHSSRGGARMPLMPRGK